MSNVYTIVVERDNSVYGAKVIADNEDQALTIGDEYYAKHNIYGLSTIMKGEISIGDYSMIEYCKNEYNELKSKGGSVDKLQDIAMNITKYLPINDKWLEGKLSK